MRELRKQTVKTDLSNSGREQKKGVASTSAGRCWLGQGKEKGKEGKALLEERKGRDEEGMREGSCRRVLWKKRKSVVGGIGLGEWEQGPRAKDGNKVRTIEG